jgi:signal transduction histidine kinase
MRMARSALLLKPDKFARLRSIRMTLMPSVKVAGGPLLLAFLYFLGAQAAFAVGTLSDRIFAPFWPPNVILFCALLLVPTRQWWVYIAAAIPAHVIAETTVAMPPGQILVAFLTNCMVAILNAWGIRRFLREPPWFGTMRNASIYLAITAGVSPAFSALGGAFVQILGDRSIANYWTYWGTWYIANALGSVALGPVFLIWSTFRRADDWIVTRRQKTEGIILGLSLVAVCALAFRETSSVSAPFLPALLYSPLPVILWAALRFGETGASGAILVVTVVSIWQSLRASTVFNSSDQGTSVLGLQIFLLGIGVLVFLLGAAIDELRRSGEAMRSLAGALLRAQDEERRRIARELHDSTGQNLVAAKLMTDQIEMDTSQSSGPVISEIRELLVGVIAEIRTVSYLLHPPLLDRVGLNFALPPYLDGFSKRTGIRVDMVAGDLGRLPANVELVLFRVIQEALTNIWRHSGSSSAQIRLACEPSKGRTRITLSIEDEGKGIPDTIRRSTLSGGGRQISSGLGLLGMRERLHEIGGRLEIDSIAGKTVIRASVTLNGATGDKK